MDEQMQMLIRLDTHMGSVMKRLDHQDSCIDSLKRQVWFATGAIALLMVLVNLSLKWWH